MKKRCTPRLVTKTYKIARTWQKTADELNNLYGVSLSRATWRDYAKGDHDIADQETRARLLLGPRVCPGCGRKHVNRKRSRSRRIREYGYPTIEVQSFDEVLKSREAIR